MSYENLLVARDGAVATVTVNRPNVLNALNAQTIDELGQVALDLGTDASVRVVVITGAGEKSFVAGADINEFIGQSPAEGRDRALRGQRALALFEGMGKPTIAAINGFALGGGCELAMACTFRFAADTARLGQPEINLGIIPGYGGTQRLARLVGRDRALDLILTGRHVQAAEALAIGLVTRVVPAADLMAEVATFAQTLASRAPVAMRYALEAVHRGLDTSLAEGAAVEATLFGLVSATDDMREGTRAFVEKRKPTFTGT